MRARRAESSRRLTFLALVANYSSRRRRRLPLDDSIIPQTTRSSLSLDFASASGRGPGPVGGNLRS
jgi:hypothetical protein